MKGQAVLMTAGGIGVTLLLLMGASWLGPAGAMVNLLTPVAAVYLGLRFGPGSALVLVSVVSLLLLQLAPVYSLAAYLALFGVGSLVLPWLLRRQVPWDRAVYYSALAGMLVMLVMTAGVVLSNGSSIGAVVDSLVKSEVDQAMQIYRDSGFNESQLKEMQGIVEQIGRFIAQTFFGLYLAGVLAIQFLSLLIVNRLSRGKYQITGTPFVRWRLPAMLIWLLIAGGFSLLVPMEPVPLIGRNLLAVLLPLYFLQGLAVVASYLQRKAYPPAMRGLVYLVVFILNPLPLIITGLGVFDLWIDFRRPRKKDI